MKNVKSSNAILGLLLKHGEKIGMLLVALGAGWLLYSSMGIEGTDKQPELLKQKVTQANSNIQATKFDDIPPISKDPDNGKRVAEDWNAFAASNVEVNSYSPGMTFWGRAPIEQKENRTDPELLVALNLQGAAGTVLIAREDPDVRLKRVEEEMRENRERELEREREREKAAEEAERGRDRGRRGRPGGRGFEGEGGPGGGMYAGGMQEGERPAGATNRRRSVGVPVDDSQRIDLVSYAAVTAVVPIHEQAREYQNTFRDAYGYNATRDLPKWLGFYVERTEVTGDGKLNWQPVKIRHTKTGRQYRGITSLTIGYATRDWINGMEPLVDRAYIHPNLTYPLLPMVGKNFDRGVVHPEIPLQAETEAKRALEERNAPVEPEPGDDDDIFGPGTARPGGGEFAGGGEGGFGRGGFGGGPMMGGMGPGGYGGGFEGGGFEGGGPMMGGGGRGGGFGGGGFGSGSEYTISPDASTAMLRFFDLTVQPGKRYKYRVKLILQDPNAKGMVLSKFLSKEVRKRIEPQTINGKAKPMPTEWSEPSSVISVPSAGDVMVASVEPPGRNDTSGEPTAQVLVKSFDVDATNRGRQAEKIMEVHRGDVLNKHFDDLEILVKGRVLKESEFSFRTNTTVLDMRGGGEVASNQKRPGRVLLMDDTGRLMVRDERTAIDDVEYHKVVFRLEEDKNTTPRGRGPAGYPGEGGGLFDF